VAEQTIPAAQLVVNDRMWMGGSALWGRVTAVVDQSDAVAVTVAYDGSQVPRTFTRSHDFEVRVDREVPS
jgi:hypothetical protein